MRSRSSAFTSGPPSPCQVQGQVPRPVGFHPCRRGDALASGDGMCRGRDLVESCKKEGHLPGANHRRFRLGPSADPHSGPLSSVPTRPAFKSRRFAVPTSLLRTVPATPTESPRRRRDHPTTPAGLTSRLVIFIPSLLGCTHPLSCCFRVTVLSLLLHSSRDSPLYASWSSCVHRPFTA